MSEMKPTKLWTLETLVDEKLVHEYHGTDGGSRTRNIVEFAESMFRWMREDGENLERITEMRIKQEPAVHPVWLT